MDMIDTQDPHTLVTGVDGLGTDLWSLVIPQRWTTDSFVVCLTFTLSGQGTPTIHRVWSGLMTLSTHDIIMLHDIYFDNYHINMIKIDTR